MQRRHRLNQIVSAVVERGQVDVPSLATEFAVSRATIRRDLEVLQRQRLVFRTHGGATIHAAFNDLPLSYKKTRDLPEKQRIARHAMAFLEGARVIGTTGGTTVSQFIQLLRDRDDLTVITNALNVATDLVGRPGPRVFVAGGEVRVSSQESVGHTAEAFLASCTIASNSSPDMEITLPSRISLRTGSPAACSSRSKMFSKKVMLGNLQQASTPLCSSSNLHRAELSGGR